MKFQIFSTFSTPIIALPHPLKFHIFFLLWTVPKGALPSHFLANSTVHAPRHRRSALRLFGSYRCAVLPGLHGGVGRLGKSPLPTRPPWLGIPWQETKNRSLCLPKKNPSMDFFGIGDSPCKSPRL